MGHALEGSGEASVIIEFFGPPGAGKTTFSHSLTARLRDAGYTVEVHLSARPGEEDFTSVRRGDAATTQNLMDPVRRLTRPFLELIAAISTNPLARDSSTDVLVSKLPRVRSFAALRTRQYLIRLSAAWQEARKSESIVIFDQGYVQAILSILLTNERILEEARDSDACNRAALRSLDTGRRSNRGDREPVETSVTNNWPAWPSVRVGSWRRGETSACSRLAVWPNEANGTSRSDGKFDRRRNAKAWD